MKLVEGHSMIGSSNVKKRGFSCAIRSMGQHPFFIKGLARTRENVTPPIWYGTLGTGRSHVKLRVLVVTDGHSGARGDAIVFVRDVGLAAPWE